jgi:hypothetical protein
MRKNELFKKWAIGENQVSGIYFVPENCFDLRHHKIVTLSSGRRRRFDNSEGACSGRALLKQQLRPLEQKLDRLGKQCAASAITTATARQKPKRLSRTPFRPFQQKRPSIEGSGCTVRGRLVDAEQSACDLRR